MTRPISVAAAGMLLLAAMTGCAVLTETPVAVTAEADDTAVLVPADPVERVTIALPEPRSAAPGLRTTGTAWKTILPSLAGYGQWILANPDPAKVGDVATPGCAAANQLSRQVAGLLGSKAYLKPAAPVFEAVTGPTPTEGATDAAVGNRVILTVIASRPSEPVLSRTGQQVSTVAPLQRTRLKITLDRGADNKWRFCTITAPYAPDASLPVPLL
jgi:hypothetical protein